MMESKRKPADVTLELKGNEVISGKSRTSSEKKVVSEAEATNLCDALQRDTVSTNFDELQQDSAGDASSVDNARAVTFKKPGASLSAKRSRQTSKCCDAPVCSSASGTEEMRAVELEKRRAEKDVEKCTREKGSEGIDWGMGEDADEETDLQENPYACVTDEDLILEDPKKTLRGWFEREGYDLRYQTEEKGVGQFLCWIDLPTEDIVGRRTRAEALVKGKKKEAVVQCALEACKVLDKYGLLRQANHEARKRKARDWEAEDYYDSDEDNFLDRTGSIERKREQRMRLAGRLEEKVETYGSLLEKHKQVAKRISHLSNSIKSWQNASSASKETTEEDALDAFMLSLSSSALTKTDVAKMKLELQNLRKEEASLMKLLNLTRPANLPALSACDSAHEDEASTAVAVSRQSGNLPASLLRGKMNARQRKQTNKRAAADSKPLLSNAVSDATVETASTEEVDSDDNDDDNDDKDESTWNWRIAKEERVQAKGRSDSSERQEKREQVRGTKKRRQEVKMPCDQVAYADNYSMWVPPKGQAGDGKTSLNEKYGY